MTPLQAMHRLTGATTVLAFCVVVLGAYVRLSDAGLGCPDWPGCYGKLLVPQGEQAIAAARQSYPERPLEHAKAWKEMVHRYLASLLGLAIIAIAIMAWRARRSGFSGQLPYWLVGLVVFQGLLGMWTVTLLVKPVIVLLHLLGGFGTLTLLWWLYLATAEQKTGATSPRLTRIATIGLLFLVLQILLGGWTSANYAALSCPDLPTCQTRWWPPMDFADAFTLWRGVGIDYEGGVLGNASRVAIHVSHRIGAVVATLALLAVIVAAWRTGSHLPVARRAAITLLILLLLQIGLGVGNVLLHLPLPIATAHNGGAALLLLVLVYIIYQSSHAAGSPG